MPLARPLLAGACSVLCLASLAAPAAAQTTGTAGSTGASTPVVTLPAPTTTTTTTAPAPTTTAPGKGSSPSTTAPGKPGGKSTTAGVPPVPVGGPPTTAPKPGAKPAPQPDPAPILARVDGDLAQLGAIADYKPAQQLVDRAQSTVVSAGATLLSARQNLQKANAVKAQAAKSKLGADDHLRQLAVAAYIGVGYTTPGLNQPAAGNGDQGAGTVSTPGGLTGMAAIDAREMLIVVAQRVRQDDDAAGRAYAAAQAQAKAAGAAVARDQASVAAAETRLLAAQQTLKQVTTAAITPGAAAASPLPDLTAAASKSTPTPPLPTTTTTAPAQMVAAVNPGTTINGAPPTSPEILSKPVLDANTLKAWWATQNRKPNITVSMDKLIDSYAAWGTKLGVRYDVAFAQSIIETGYFSFPSYGQLTDKDNNFAGIGACDTCAHGWSFPTADTGVQAQLELLRKYATSDPLPKGVKDLIGTGVGGCCKTWTQLAGVWASSTVYGISIMTLYDHMLTWLIPQEEMAVGLIAPTSPAARGPDLAPLPGASKPATPSGKGDKTASLSPATTVPAKVAAASTAKRSK